jgi:hypothetical protein
MSKTPELTPRQIELANQYKKSYRNRFVAGGNHPDQNDWLEMVKNGYAEVKANCAPFGGSDYFWLTLVGAKAALKRGEKLCNEDFPND